MKCKCNRKQSTVPFPLLPHIIIMGYSLLGWGQFLHHPHQKSSSMCGKLWPTGELGNWILYQLADKDGDSLTNAGWHHPMAPVHMVNLDRFISYRWEYIQICDINEDWKQSNWGNWVWHISQARWICSSVSISPFLRISLSSLLLVSVSLCWTSYVSLMSLPEWVN